MPIAIEIEIRSPLSNESLQELRDYLRENCKDLGDIHLKTKPPLPNQMGGDLFDPVLTGLIEGIAVFGLEQIIHKVWEPVILPNIKKGFEYITNKNKQAGKPVSPMELGVSIKDGSAKTYFYEKADGNREVFNNVNYAIDPEHTYAVLIGCSDYKKQFPDIAPAKGNIEDMRKILTSKGCVGLSDDHIFIAFNETADNIQKLLYNVSRMPEIETFIFYYVGHGHQVNATRLFLTASNTERPNDSTILAGIDYDFVKTAILEGSKARQKIVLLDACHSGIAAQALRNSAYDIDVEGTYVLASSAGDEPSFFLPENRNTFFTEAVIDLLEKGLDNTEEMLSLNDLYEKTTKILKEKKFPLPIQKRDLNIPSEKYFISLNPAFSYEKLKDIPRKLFEKGMFDEAMSKLQLLIDRYPKDYDLLKTKEEFNKEIRYKKLVQEGHNFFYADKKNYYAAIEKYTEALKLRNGDLTTIDNLRECKLRIKDKTPPPLVKKEPTKKEPPKSVPQAAPEPDAPQPSVKPPVAETLSDIPLNKHFSDPVIQRQTKFNWQLFFLISILIVVFVALVVKGIQNNGSNGGASTSDSTAAAAEAARPVTPPPVPSADTTTAGPARSFETKSEEKKK